METLQDPKDQAIMQARLQAYAARAGLTAGDVIRFKDGKKMRIAYVWTDQEGNPFSVQPCWGGSFFMHKSGNCEMSGSLSDGIDSELFQSTDETAKVRAWFFHHDYAGAGMGRDFSYSARVWYVDCPSPRNYSEAYHLSQVDSEWARERTSGNYHYLITKGGTSWKAFEHENALLAWMESEGLKLSEPLAPRGKRKSQFLENAQ